MPNLKDLKTRIDSVKSTQKITSAMKLVAAAKLRRAEEVAQASRPYSTRMNDVIASLAAKADASSAPELLVGRGDVKTHLLVIISADKGLCGGFNAFITRAARKIMAEKQAAGQKTMVYVVGRKSADAMSSEIADKTFARIEGIQGKAVFGDAEDIAAKIIEGFEAGTFDGASMLFNKFVNVIKQDVTHSSLIPAEIGEVEASEDTGLQATYEYEPDEEEILKALLPRNVATQIFSALLESSASELAARMTAMDNATRNAGDMIDRLTLVYNRTRQANITKELIEIISGAEAL
jgi:F-type H+-transporting ATPase subunit gamma